MKQEGPHQPLSDDLQSNRRREKFIKDTLGDKYLVWKNAVDPASSRGYDLWQPREGTVFYMADNIPPTCGQLRSGALEQVGITVAICDQ